MSPSKVRANEV